MNANVLPKHPKGSKRRDAILEAALSLAVTNGFNNFTSVALSKVLDCSWGTIFHYFGNMDNLRDAVMQLAIEQENLKVILDGLTCKNPVALDAPTELKDLAKSLLD